MRAVIQRVKQCSVSIDGRVISSVEKGVLVLLGIEVDDGVEDAGWLAGKICHMRIFDDENGIMNLPLGDTRGEMMVISQFTLFAMTKKGNRPSYMYAAKSEKAIPLYHDFIEKSELILGKKVKTGEFGAMMEINLINDGPVTIIIDTKNKE